MLEIRCYRGHDIRMVSREDEDGNNKLLISVVDVVQAITSSQNPRKYWNTVKHRISRNSPELIYGIEQFRLSGKNGVLRSTDVAPPAVIARLVQDIPACRDRENDIVEWINSQAGEKKVLLPLMRAAYTPGKLMEYYHSADKGIEESLMRAELEYYRGNFEGAVRIARSYLKDTNLYTRGSAANICVLGSVALGRSEDAEEGFEQLKSVLDEAKLKEDPELEAVLELMLDAIYTVIGHQDVASLTKIESLFPQIPRDLWPWAWHIYCRRLCAEGKYEKILGVVEVAQAMLKKMRPIQQAYLNIVAAVASVNMKKTDQARNYLIKGMQLCHHDGIHVVIADMQLLLPGLVDAQLRGEFPDECDEINEVTERIMKGVNSIRKRMGGKYLPVDLTRTEMVMATLASRGWKNKEIADFMGFAENTVKRYLSVIYDKLHIRGRKELKKYHL